GSAAVRPAGALAGDVVLEKQADTKPRQLAGGAEQRIAIARALMTRPALLLDDDPTGNLDTKTAATVFELLRRFNRDYGCAILVVTHDPRLAETCDRTIQLVDGRVVS